MIMRNNELFTPISTTGTFNFRDDFKYTITNSFSKKKFSQ